MRSGRHFDFDRIRGLLVRRGRIGLADWRRAWQEDRPLEKQTRQLTLTLEQWNIGKCPECGADLERIEGHWLLRDCALCGWCRRWFGRPADDTGTSTYYTSKIVNADGSPTGLKLSINSDREPEKGS
jgi:hypothetical protein